MNFALKQDASDCLWMQAGVVKTKQCYKAFSCNGCRFDRAISRVCRSNELKKEQGLPLDGKKADFVFWQDRLMRMPFSKRPCIHHMKGHIGFRNCPKAYHCVDCEFDQYFNDQFKVHAVLKPVAFDDLGGISLPVGYYFHSGHAWIKIEDQGMVRMGIDDFAGRLFGKFDKISTPLIGEKLGKGMPAVTLKRNGHQVSFLSPVSGVLAEVNKQVKKTPDLINREPYTDGWIFMLYCPELRQDLRHLMFTQDSKGFMKKEVHRLYEFIEEETQVKAADGGTLVPDLFGNLPGVSWETLVQKFIPQEA